MEKYSASELKLLHAWKDKAGGWRWLHYSSMKYYKDINSKFVYASILLSTLASAGGFSTAGNVGKTNSIMDSIQFYMGYVIGTTNVIIGLINSFQRFGKAAEKTELHASAGMQYAMLQRTLETELSLTDDHRKSDLLVSVRQEMDRLLAQSPTIPNAMISAYNVAFPNAENVPDVCSELVTMRRISDSPIIRLFRRLSRQNETSPPTPPSLRLPVSEV
jgi:hypothetical protein